MDLQARVDVNCERKDGLMDGRTDGNRTPMSHAAKASETKRVEYSRYEVYNVCI